MQQPATQQQQSSQVDKTKNSEFTLAQDYMGEKKIRVPVNYYSGLLKAIGVSKSRYLIIDLENFTFSLLEEKAEKPDPKEIFHIRDIKKVEVDTKKRDIETFKIYIYTTDDRKKFKLRNDTSYDHVIKALKAIQTQDGKRLIEVTDRHHDKDSKHHDSSDDESHSKSTAHSNETTGRPQNEPYDSTTATAVKAAMTENKGVSSGAKNVTGNTANTAAPIPGDSKPQTQKKDEMKGNEKMLKDGNQVREAHKHDEEYQYLKWKYIDRFEPNAPALPEHLRKFADKDVDPMATKDNDKEKKTLEDKHKEYHGEEIKVDDRPRNIAPGQGGDINNQQQFGNETPMGVQSGAIGGKDNRPRENDTTMTIASRNTQGNNLQSPTDNNRDRDQGLDMNRDLRGESGRGQDFDRNRDLRGDSGRDQDFDRNRDQGFHQDSGMGRNLQQQSGQSFDQRDQGPRNLQQQSGQSFDQRDQYYDQQQYGQQNNQGQFNDQQMDQYRQDSFSQPQQIIQGNNMGPIRPGTEDWKAKEAQLEQRERALDARERELKQVERDLHMRKIDLKSVVLEKKEQGLVDKENEIYKLENEIGAIQQELVSITQQREFQRQERDQFMVGGQQQDMMYNNQQ